MTTHPLRDYRLRTGTTIGNLASRTGVSAASISRIETGTQLPSPDLAKALETLTGVERWKFRPDIWEPPAKEPCP